MIRSQIRKSELHGSFHHQAKIAIKTDYYCFFAISSGFFIFEYGTDVNVPSIKNKQEN
jgi:hypothetical protein